MKVLLIEYCQLSQLNEKICEDGKRRALFAQDIFSKMTKQPEQRAKVAKPLKPSVRLSVLAAIEKIGPLAAPLGHDIAPGRSVQGWDG